MNADTNLHNMWSSTVFLIPIIFCQINFKLWKFLGPLIKLVSFQRETVKHMVLIITCHEAQSEKTRDKIVTVYGPKLQFVISNAQTHIVNASEGKRWTRSTVLLAYGQRFKQGPQDPQPFSVLMLRDRSSSRQLGGRRMLQSKMILLADCCSAPQMHLGVSSMPLRYRHVPKRPTPVLSLSLFSATHRLRGCSEPDEKQKAGLTKNWASGVALSLVAFHDSKRLKPEFTSAAAWRLKGRRECRRCVPWNCALWTRVWRGWLVFSCAWSTNLKVECSLRMWASGMPESIMRYVSFNVTSSFLVRMLWHQAGAAYSVAL